MPNITVRINNLDKFEAALRKSPVTIGKHLQKAINLATILFLGATKSNIRGGVDMWKAPIDTGRMWNSLQSTVIPLRGEVYPTVNYAIYVHEGTRYMQARPFLSITERTESQKITNIFETALDDAMTEMSHG